MDTLHVLFRHRLLPRARGFEGVLLILEKVMRAILPSTSESRTARGRSTDTCAPLATAALDRDDQYCPRGRGQSAAARPIGSPRTSLHSGGSAPQQPQDRRRLVDPPTACTGQVHDDVGIEERECKRGLLRAPGRDVLTHDLHFSFDIAAQYLPGKSPRSQKAPLP